MAKATCVFSEKWYGRDGAIIEMVIWQLPRPLPGSPHPLKYRLYFGRGGRRLVGYDNERGKGDHRHVEDREMAYRFVSVERLIDDFFADVKAAGGEP